MTDITGTKRVHLREIMMHESEAIGLIRDAICDCEKKGDEGPGATTFDVLAAIATLMICDNERLLNEAYPD